MRSFRQFDEESQAVEGRERNRDAVGVGRSCQRVGVPESSASCAEGEIVRVRARRRSLSRPRSRRIKRQDVVLPIILVRVVTRFARVVERARNLSTERCGKLPDDVHRASGVGV